VDCEESVECRVELMRVRLSPLPQSMHEHGWSEGRGRAREGSEWSGSSRSGAPLSPASLPPPSCLSITHDSHL